MKSVFWELSFYNEEHKNAHSRHLEREGKNTTITNATVDVIGTLPCHFIEEKQTQHARKIESRTAAEY